MKVCKAALFMEIIEQVNMQKESAYGESNLNYL